MKRLWLGLGVALLLVAALGSVRLPSLSNPSTEHSFSVALIGDLPYTFGQEEQFRHLIADINQSDVTFVIHDGDLKSGSTHCSNELIEARKQLFETFTKPFIYVLGDNEWTDCHRDNNGAYDPLERLDYVRALFTEGDRSMAVPSLALERQSSVPEFSRYRENVRWAYNTVLFATLHIVGSNNNLGRNPDGDAEYRDRTAANLAWLRETFALAKAGDYAGLMLIVHANPLFELQPDDPNRTGFNEFIAALETELSSYNRPTILVHGDTHHFQIDKPLPRRGPAFPHFTRVETFGSPNVHWLKATVDPDSANVFEFSQELKLEQGS